jgi:hypothetical protein
VKLLTQLRAVARGKNTQRFAGQQAGLTKAAASLPHSKAALLCLARDMIFSVFLAFADGRPLNADSFLGRCERKKRFNKVFSKSSS